MQLGRAPLRRLLAAAAAVCLLPSCHVSFVAASAVADPIAVPDPSTSLTTFPAASPTTSGGSGSSLSSGLAAVLSANPNLSAVAALLQPFADLLGQIQNQSHVTIFLPSNAALAAPATATYLQAVNATPGFLAAALQYHVLYETVLAQDFAPTPRFAHTLLRNDSRFEDVTGGQVLELRRTESGNLTVTAGDHTVANVVVPDIPLANGVLHIIDSVLPLPQSTTTTLQAAALTAFLGALDLATQSQSSLLNTFNTATDLTIFAPRNLAFQAIGNVATAWSPADLASILSYHVVPAAQGYSSLLTNTTNVPTLAGNTKTLNVTLTPAGAILVNGAARVVVADILLANGVLHVIDAVLDPSAAAAPPPPPAGTTPAVFWPNATPATTVPFTANANAVATGGSTVSVNPALTSTTDAPAAGYSTAPTRNTEQPTGSGTASSKAGAAPRITGAVEVAALFGGAAAAVAIGAL